MTCGSRTYVLGRRPTGTFSPDDLELRIGPVPVPADGEALVRNEWLSLDPSNRVWMGEGESYMPPVTVGDVMRGIGIGTVVTSRNPRLPVGRRLLGLFGWRDHAIVRPGDGSQAMRLPRLPGVSAPSQLGALGVTGLTAHLAMLRVGRPRRGETVFVGAAAGATGSIAGQLAKMRGARVVGMAGTPEKCRWLIEELGFDAAINRRDPNWPARLAEATPDGIDLDFELVGGEVMERVFDRLNLHARVVLCGLVAEYDRVVAASGPANFSNLLMRRVTVHGFNVGDHRRRFPLAILQLAAWLKLGRIKEQHAIIEGLENAPSALAGLLDGAFTGKVAVRIH